MSCAESGEAATARAHENRASLIVSEPQFAAEFGERPSKIGRQCGIRRSFGSFRAGEDLLRPTQTQVSGIDADRLGNPGSGPSQEEKKCVIPASRYGPLVRRIQECVHFRSGQVTGGWNTVRLLGIANTRWAMASKLGSLTATWRKKDRIAVSAGVPCPRPVPPASAPHARESRAPRRGRGP